MHPVLFRAGPFTVYTYGVLAAAGFLLGLSYAYRQAPRAGIDRNKIWNLAIYGVIISLVTSKLWFVASEWKFYAARPRALIALATIQSAGAFYGGILGGIVWVVLYTRAKKMPLLPVLDLAAAPVALGHAIGRLGCFAAGCCYGKPTHLAWGVTFRSPYAARLSGTPLDIALHPTQLYESAAEFLNFALLVWLGAKKRFPGQIVGAYFFLYGVERGVIEFFRDDPGRTLLFHDKVSFMQIVSVALVLAGMFLWMRARGSNGAASDSSQQPAQPHGAPAALTHS